jgi:hypothetical protein
MRWVAQVSLMEAGLTKATTNDSTKAATGRPDPAAGERACIFKARRYRFPVVALGACADGLDTFGDAPFARLDLVSCRNLFTYLSAEAQQKILSLFHFALRQGGVLLLGSSESVGSASDRFEPISTKHRLYRRVSRGRPGEVEFHGQGSTPFARLAGCCRSSRYSAGMGSGNYHGELCSTPMRRPPS